MPEPTGKEESSCAKRKEESSCAEWIVGIQLALGCVDHNEVRTGSICRIPEKIREAEAKDKKGHQSSYNYKPEIVAMGPFHRGTRSDLQIMEQTKWRYTQHLLSSPTHQDVPLETVRRCSEGIKELDGIIRASYGEEIEMGPEEFSRMMLLDACFLLEFLVRLCGDDKSGEPPLDDPEKMLRILTDLTLLENQIPFVLLPTLYSKISPSSQQQLPALCDQDQQLSPQICDSPQNLANALFGRHNVAGADFSKGVYHFLHFIHLCSPDPYKQQVGHTQDPQPLKRCARKLQAIGIAIKASQPNDSQGIVAVNDKTGTVTSALKAFVDKFEFKIEFHQRELIIPTLHIKEATEVKWRNLIAWEQLRLIGIGYKFTSYAHFFKGLVSSIHDIQLLKENNIIKVQTKAKDEDLVTMFQSITTGAEQVDGRYNKECDGLNKAEVNNGVVGYCVFFFRMVWHYLCRSWEWLLYRSLSFLQSIIDTYLGIPGKIIAFFVGAAALALTITQTIYAVRAGKK